MQTRLRRFAFVIYLIMACSMAGIAQSRKVTGTVKDTEGLEVIGATVTVPGTKAAAITDVDGKYTIDVPSGGKNQSYVCWKQGCRNRHWQPRCHRRCNDRKRPVAR